LVWEKWSPVQGEADGLWLQPLTSSQRIGDKQWQRDSKAGERFLKGFLSNQDETEISLTLESVLQLPPAQSKKLEITDIFDKSCDDPAWVLGQRNGKKAPERTLSVSPTLSRCCGFAPLPWAPVRDCSEPGAPNFC